MDPLAPDGQRRRDRLARATTWKLGLLVAGLALVGWSIVSPGKAASYVIGIVLLAAAVESVLVGATRDRRHARLLIVGGTTLIALAGASAIVEPWRLQTTHRAARVVEFDVDGDAIGSRWARNGSLVLVSLDSGDAQRSYHLLDAVTGEVRWSVDEGDTNDATLVSGRGDVVGVARSPGGVTLYGAGGPVVWTDDTVGADDRAHVPVAALDDGAIVVYAYDDDDATTSDLIAVEPNGIERWRVDVNRGSAFVPPLLGDSESVLPDRAYIGSGTGLLVLDDATGDPVKVSDGLDGYVTGDGVAVVLHRDDNECRVTIHRADHESSRTIQQDCPLSSTLTGMTPEIVALVMPAAFLLVDTSSGETELVESPLDSLLDHELEMDTEGPYVVERRDGSTIVRRVGSGEATVTLAGTWNVSEWSTTDSVVAWRRARSRNPMRPSHLVEVAVYDTATGTRCAAATLSGEWLDAIAVTARRRSEPPVACQALVNAGGNTYLVEPRY